MTPTGSPTLLVPVGSLGEATLTRVVKTLGNEVANVREHRPDDGPEVLGDRLEGLLRVGASPRLDVLVFVDGIEGADPTPAVTQVSEVLAARFARVFPINAPPEQRAAAIHVVVYTPALAPSTETEQLLDRLQGLLDAAREAPHPTLSRVWLAASQTSAGVLSPEDLVNQGAGFALAVLGAGIRDTDALHRRLAHPHDDNRFGFLSVGTLDLPLGRIESWARTRAAYDALTALVERTAPAQGRMRGLEPEVVDRWTSPFSSGPAAEALKNAAWKVAGGKALPERITLGPLDGPESVRRRYAGLFVEPGASGAHSPEVDDALRALDQLHTETLEDVSRTIEAPLRGRLGELRPLADLPAYGTALDQLRRKLDVEEALPTGPQQQQGPTLEALEKGTDAIPRPGVLRLLGLATALSVGFVLLGLTSLVLLRPPPQAAAGMTTGVRTVGATSNPTTVSHVVPWVIGGIGGGIAGLSVTALAGRRSRKDLLGLLQARADALQAARSAGLASGPSAEASNRLALHRARVRRHAVDAVDRASARIRLTRQALQSCRAQLGQRLDASGVAPSSTPDREDLGPLFDPATPFHAPLLGPGATRDWVRRARRYADVEVLADHIVDGAMPRDGIAVDIPASDPSQVLELAAIQTSALLDTSLFDDQDAVEEARQTTEAFARQVVRTLAPGCSPRREDGMPEPGLRPGATFVVGPSDGRTPIEDALSRSQAGIDERYWTSSRAPMVLFVRTWEGYSLDHIRRGVHA